MSLSVKMADQSAPSPLILTAFSSVAIRVFSEYRFGERKVQEPPFAHLGMDVSQESDSSEKPT